ncbi:hypothetical protein Glove_83g42 [Diversispora epigaea]|uniref:Uncharacterized protein n=1 Tax=Diversispora epigaea TaxID=1348612 RepID=A0A397JH75_9GLOM|nr:hypothetical protein Glove_83g42 [Diversispora epigaea]
MMMKWSRSITKKQKLIDLRVKYIQILDNKNILMILLTAPSCLETEEIVKRSRIEHVIAVSKDTATIVFSSDPSKQSYDGAPHIPLTQIFIISLKYY